MADFSTATAEAEDSEITSSKGWQKIIVNLEYFS